MSNDKQTPAQLEYSRAVAADPSAFYTAEAPAKVDMTPLEKARHKAFLDGHPIARQESGDGAN
jgi:hypothetical protein